MVPSNLHFPVFMHLWNVLSLVVTWTSIEYGASEIIYIHIYVYVYNLNIEISLYNLHRLYILHIYYICVCIYVRYVIYNLLTMKQTVASILLALS